MRVLVLVGLVFFHASPAFGSQDDFHGSRSLARRFSLLLAPHEPARRIRDRLAPFGMRMPTAR
ncbi:hypothetical protein ACIHFD_51020 [Nonomuraea sp. NPDC051941]|uniref:hypothetical protein n=1 Tax=Nonomuraea sp. NPDC051941 TaxID=3364373 RepID=UPI0037C9EB9F